jgi:protein-tyrosine phosphatase
MDKALAIEIVRTATASYRISWQSVFANTPLTLYGGSTPTSIDYANPLARGVRHAIELPGLPVPWFFALQPAGERPLVVGARHLALEGAINLRDIGGYATAEGRRVRWGCVYRSGHLSGLSDAARDEVAALNIHTVCDFRLPEEREAENAVLPNSPRLETVGIPPGLNDRHFFHRLFASTDDPSQVVEEIHLLLRAFVENFAAHYQRMFEVLLSADEGGILLNCSAGKERTGVGVVLFLMALGVPRATIRQDFLLSRRYFPIAAEIPRVLRKYAVPDKDPATLQALIMPLLETRESYIDTVLAAIDLEVAKDGGSVAAFLARQYGIEAPQLATLRDKFTMKTEE